MPVLDFSEEAFKKLEELLGEAGKGIVQRSTQASRSDQYDDNKAPDSYIFKTPADGIPAIDTGDDSALFGTGSGEPDVPGEATCEVYKEFPHPVTGRQELRRVDGLTYPVKNLTTTAIGEQYVRGARTKFNEWVADTGGAGSCHVIRFWVISVDEGTRTALVSVEAVQGGCSIADTPGIDPVGFVAAVEVCDPSGCFFNEPSDDLEFRRGWAHYMTPVIDSVCDCDTGTGTATCDSRTGTGTERDNAPYTARWEVFSLCCETPVCETT